MAFAAGHIPGAINLPHASIDERVAADLDPRAIHVTYCWSAACNASTKAAAALASLGITVKELIGGLSAWGAEGYAVERGPERTTSTAPAPCAC